MSKVRMNPPCYPKCESRELYCHSKCQRYKDWRAKLDQENEKSRGNDVVDDYIIKKVSKIADKRRK